MKNTELLTTQVEFLDNYIGKGVIVLISGKAGVGKSTLAKLIQTEFSDRGFISVIVPMATGVKNAAVKCFGWDRKKDDNGRKLLQNIGRIGREYNVNLWVSTAMNGAINGGDIFSPDFIIVDDWRFPNEYEFITENYGNEYNIYRVKIISPNREVLSGTDAYNDYSETSLDDYTDFDFVFDNSQNGVILEHAETLVNSILGE